MNGEVAFGRQLRRLQVPLREIAVREHERKVLMPSTSALDNVPACLTRMYSFVTERTVRIKPGHVRALLRACVHVRACV